MNPEHPDIPGARSFHRSADIAFIEKFGRALHRYGLASNGLETALEQVAELGGYRGQFFATPTAIFATLEKADATHNLLIRVKPGDVNLEKLSSLDELLRAVLANELSPAEAAQRVDRIVESPQTYGPLLRLIGWAMTSSCASRFFGGGWREFVVCAIIGVVIGALSIIAGRFPRKLPVFEATAAFLAGLIATAAARYLEPTSVYVATCAGLIALLPGLTFTIAVNELATSHVVAGTARLASALVLFLQIGFGVAVGLKAGDAIFGHPARVDPVALAAWTEYAALLMAPIGFTVLFQARLRDMGWIIGIGVLAFVSSRAGSEMAGIEIGAFVGALTVGLASNLHARLLNRPAAVTLVTGIILLVPGSLGFRSLSSWIANDVVSGMKLAFSMSLMAVALVTGLLLARSIVAPRRSL